jgi:hypothetical protein
MTPDEALARSATRPATDWRRDSIDVLPLSPDLDLVTRALLCSSLTRYADDAVQ